MGSLEVTFYLSECEQIMLKSIVLVHFNHLLDRGGKEVDQKWTGGGLEVNRKLLEVAQKWAGSGPELDRK